MVICPTPPTIGQSILPIVSKIFEKHINKHLMAYLNKYRLIHEHQSGFRQRHSCQTALVKLIDEWIKCIDKGEMIGALFIDFRKAFDLVDHNILLRKLLLYKFNQSAVRWTWTDAKELLKEKFFFHTFFCVLVRICNQTSSNQHLLLLVVEILCSLLLLSEKRCLHFYRH